MENVVTLILVAISGILVGWVACALFSWPYLKEGDKVIKAQQKLLEEKDELIEDKRDMIQVLDERISLGNEHISALLDLLQNKDSELARLGGQLAYQEHLVETFEDQLQMANEMRVQLDQQLKEANDKIAELEKA
jgi:chromosome segregation ATPase